MGRRPVGEAVRRLRRAGYRAEPMVVRGHPNDVIRDTMQEIGADLLIVGSRGHSYSVSDLTGSVPLHDIFAESYAVLLLRWSPDLP